MALFRIALFTTAVVLAFPPSHAKAETVEARYTGGTVKAIPTGIYGTLSLSDAKEMRFRYGTTVFSVPYTQITDTLIPKQKTKYVMGRVPVPTVHRHEELTVVFKDAAGVENTVNFYLTWRDASNALEALNTRRTDLETENALAVDPNSWWGDKYWKTTRNRTRWEEKNTVPPPQASGSNN